MLQLLDDARRGHDASLGTLLELYRDYLRLVARTRIDQHLQAQVSASDLVQETFLEAYRDFYQFRGNTEAELVTWLRRILIHNLGRLVQRQVLAQKREVRRQVSLERLLAMQDPSAMEAEKALASSDSSPSADAQRREQAVLLADQLARLPPAYHEVIVLRNLKGLPFQEVAERMGRSPAATRVLWVRALDRLRDLLQAEDLI